MIKIFVSVLATKIYYIFVAKINKVNKCKRSGVYNEQKNKRNIEPICC